MNNRINVYRCGGEEPIAKIDNLKKGITISLDEGAPIHDTVTIDRDKGTTPMMIICRHPGCKKMATSQFYQVDQGMIPTHEWYKPGRSELEKMKENNRTLYDHCKRGGLLLREIKYA